jgi:hypothetical protein
MNKWLIKKKGGTKYSEIWHDHSNTHWISTKYLEGMLESISMDIMQIF